MVKTDEFSPNGKWTFDEDVTECFDDMLARSIPQYDVMRRAVFDLCCRYQLEDTGFLDIGASRGEVIAPLIDRFGAHNSYHLVEVSEPMLDVLRERFGGWERCPSKILHIHAKDLREWFPPFRFCVVTSVLTMQFVPIEHRQKILSRIYDSLLPRGCLILVEKVLGNTHEIDEKMVDVYYSMKKENGYTQDQIDRKRLSLEGVLVPVTAEMNELFLNNAGFTKVDCFWRWMNFAGWVAVK